MGVLPVCSTWKSFHILIKNFRYLNTGSLSPYGTNLWCMRAKPLTSNDLLQHSMTVAVFHIHWKWTSKDCIKAYMRTESIIIFINMYIEVKLSVKQHITLKFILKSWQYDEQQTSFCNKFTFSPKKKNFFKLSLHTCIVDVL